MSVQLFRRCGITLCLAALASGCSSIDLSQPALVNECKRNPSSCMYEGSYEPGERDYAEQEAKRLNRASLERLRRGAIK